MSATDAQGLPLSTWDDVAGRWREFRYRQDRLLSGASDALLAVVEADPSFAVARAVAALQGHLGRLPGRDVEGDLAAALDGRAAHPWERSYVHAVKDTIERGRWPSLDTWRTHHDDFPGDMLAMDHLVPHLEMSADADLIAEAAGRIRRTIDVVGEQPTLLGHLAMSAAERLDLDEAERLGQRSLELEPAGMVGAHPITHVRYESGDHADGARWLRDWLPGADPESGFFGHLVWHAALHHLALGDAEEVLALYRRCGGEAAEGRLFDGSSLLWRCQLHGLVPRGTDPVGVPISDVARGLVDDPPAVAVGYHVALALACSADVDALERLAARAGRSATPGVAEVLADLAQGLAAYVQDDPETAAACLVLVDRHIDRVGGSRAQREVLEDTLIEAMIRAGRFDEARRRLERRLERRPSPFDDAWHARTTDAVTS